MPNNLTLGGATFAPYAGGQALVGGYAATDGSLITGTTGFAARAKFQAGNALLSVALSQANVFWIGTDGSGNVRAQYGSGANAVDFTTTVSATAAVRDVELRAGPSGGVLLIDGAQVATNAKTLGAAVPAFSPAYKFTVANFDPSLGQAYPFAYGFIDRAEFWSSESGSGGGSATSLWLLDGNGTDTASSTPTLSLSGPSSAVVGAASANFTATLSNGTGSVTVTPVASGLSGTFSPTSLTLTVAAPSATFTFTPSATGSGTIGVTNNSGLTNPSAIAFTATSNLYALVDASDANGQSMRVLVPSSGSAHPYSAGAGAYLVLYAHGSSETYTSITAGSSGTGNAWDVARWACVAAMLDAGYIVIAPNQRGNNWGNQLSVDDLAYAYRWALVSYNILGVVIWSQSMGGLSGLNAMSAGRIPAKGWLGTYSVCGLSAAYTGGQFTAAMNTAHGISGSAQQGYDDRTIGLDPRLRKGWQFPKVPFRFYASAADVVVPEAQHTTPMRALLAGWASSVQYVPCAGDHGDVSHFKAAEYVTFLASCFAASDPSANAPVVPATTATVVVPAIAGAPKDTSIRWHVLAGARGAARTAVASGLATSDATTGQVTLTGVPTVGDAAVLLEDAAGGDMVALYPTTVA